MISCHTSLVLQLQTPVVRQQPHPPALLLIYSRLIVMLWLLLPVHPPSPPNTGRARLIPSQSRRLFRHRRALIIRIRICPAGSPHNARLLIRTALRVRHSIVDSACFQRIRPRAQKSGLISSTAPIHSQFPLSRNLENLSRTVPASYNLRRRVANFGGIWERGRSW